MKIIVAVYAILFGAQALQGQFSNAAFIHYTTDQGLSNDHVTGILKDKHGFLWISTVDGLNRFDGRNFKVFRHDPKSKNSLTDNNISGIALAPDGAIWIATASGLCKLDPAQLQIIRIPLPENADTVLNDLATKVDFDSEGYVWTTGEFGLYRINPVTHQVDYAKRTPQPTPGWHGMMIDDKDQLWLMKDTLRRFDPKTETFKLYYGIAPPQGLLRAGPLSMVQDATGQIWSGTWGGGIWKYNADADEFVSLPPSDKIAMMLCPDQHRDGRMFFWVGGGTFGLSAYDPQSHDFFEFRPQPEDPYSHNSYLAHTFFKDHATGDVWIGTEVGLEHYAPSAIRFGRAIIPPEKDRNQFSLVSAVVRDNTDVTRQKYFVAVWGFGLYTWNKRSGIFTRMRSPDSQMTGGGNFNLLQDSKGRVWSCMKDGVGRYDPVTGRYRDYLRFFKYPERNNLIWCGVEDRQGNLWFGAGREGLFRYNEQADRIESVFYDTTYADGKGNINITSLSVDTLGRVWLAANSSGLIRYDPGTGEAKRFWYEADGTALPVCNGIVASQKNGRLYAIFYKALLELDTEGTLLRAYTQQSGLQANRLGYMGEDHQGKIWFNSTFMLHCFDPVTGDFTYYGKPDGLFSNTITDALSVTHDGEIFVGFQNAFNFFYPDQLRHNDIPPAMAITSIKVMDAERQASLYDSVLILKPNEDFFQIEFAALNFNQPERNQYAYRLEGFNDEWIYTDRPVATFTNLDGGDYRLHMKAANNDGVWNEKGVVMYIQVHPPFHKTIWFSILIAIAITGILFGLAAFRQRQRKRIETFREQLARDLHDEMGSTLSSIRFFSEYADQQVRQDKPQVVPVLQRISESATNLGESMQDIIWAMKSDHDQLEDLATHMTEFGLRLMEARNIRFNTNISQDFSGKHLSPEVRRNVYLIFKEAINNAAKYSAAATVELALALRRGILHMTIEDNGKGFDMNNLRAEGSGHGLQNMQQRAIEIGGKLEITSQPGQGTRITLEVHI